MALLGHSLIDIIMKFSVAAVSNIVILIGSVNDQIATLAKAIRSNFQRLEKAFDTNLYFLWIHLKLK